MIKRYFNKYTEFQTFFTLDRRVWRGTLLSLVDGVIELEHFHENYIPARGIRFHNGAYTTSDLLEQQHLDKLSETAEHGMISAIEWARLRHTWYESRNAVHEVAAFRCLREPIPDTPSPVVVRTQKRTVLKRRPATQLRKAIERRMALKARGA